MSNTGNMGDETARSLRAATGGFDALFANDLDGARAIFADPTSPFHSLGAGVCAFLEAALGMEVRLPFVCFTQELASRRRYRPA